MRRAFLLALLATARLAAGACLDDCRDEWGGSGPDYEECVADCGACGNGDLEGDEECDDGNLAGGDCCDAACRPEPAGSPCRDGEDPTDDELCTTSVCDGDGACEREEIPAPGCAEAVQPGASALRVRDAGDDARDRLVWTWRRGPAAARVDFGKPTETTAYALCLYDATGAVASFVLPAGGDCGTQSCWTGGGGAFRYRARHGEPDGARSARLRQGRRPGQAVIRVEADGDLLDLPDLAGLVSPLTVQLRRSGGGTCWAARYALEPGRRQAAGRLRVRSGPAASPATTTTVTTTTVTTSTGPAASTSTTAVTPTSTSNPGGSTTSTTAPAATVEVTVRDPAGAPVADADVTIDYGAAAPGASDFTGEAGVAVFAGEPAGLPATVTAEDDDGRTGSASSPGFVAGLNRLAITVR